MVMLCINYHLRKLKCESHLWIPNKLFTSTSFPHLVLLRNSLKSVHGQKQKEVWFETVKLIKNQSLGKTGLSSKWCCSYLSKMVVIMYPLWNLFHHQSPQYLFYQRSSGSAVRPEGTNTHLLHWKHGDARADLFHTEKGLEVNLFTHPFSSELSLQRTRKHIFVSVLLLLLETSLSSLEADKNVPLHLNLLHVDPLGKFASSHTVSSLVRW